MDILARLRPEREKVTLGEQKSSSKRTATAAPPPKRRIPAAGRAGIAAASQTPRSDNADSESVPSLCYSFGLDRSRNEFRNVEKFSGRDTLFGAKACSTYRR